MRTPLNATFKIKGRSYKMRDSDWLKVKIAFVVLKVTFFKRPRDKNLPHVVGVVVAAVVVQLPLWLQRHSTVPIKSNPL